ncbi:hypothetical protein ACFYY8_13050 [Streptosporangium sp. NPDC001559]
MGKRPDHTTECGNGQVGEREAAAAEEGTRIARDVHDIAPTPSG